MENNKAETAQQKQIISPPSVTLPKGGGAIRGIGEKFASNPVTGTGSMTVPIATSPGRSGFGPQLSLSYDSGSGNGVFGFGWSLSLPSITRKTDKGLPKYQDADESDIFILSGAEDLVPILVQNAQGQWVSEPVPPQTVGSETYNIQRYHPRIEGLFARIERWTKSDGDVHWRSISKDNILTLYGKDSNSRIYEPDNPQHIFSWLICETRDDKGNAITYEYKAENGIGVDLTQAHERNRGVRNGSRRTANRYLKRIRYGNRIPLLNTTGQRPRFLTQAQLNNATWMFEVIVDYGEHDLNDPKPNNAGEWLCRHDPFSSYRAGFEVRSYRICQRVLMFHHFPGEANVGQDCLVRSTDFVYRNIRNTPDDLKKGHPVASFIASVTQNGYKRQAAGGYLKKSLPPVEFKYSQVPLPEQFAQLPIQEVDVESLENLPMGLDGRSYQWMDLDGEGTLGILTEQANGWFYKRNLSANNQVKENEHERTVAHLGPVELVTSKPVDGLTDGAQFLDLSGDGQVDLVQMEGPVRGFYERTDDTNWESFQAFTLWPNVDVRDPDLKFVDVTGDGHTDILITEGEALTWYPSLAEQGFGPAIHLRLPFEEEKGPRLLFADGTQSIYMADCSGDGLSDIVRIRNGEVCYWPNLGYGRFGAKVTMDNAPWFDAPDQFDQKRVRLVDTDGSGTADIIYLHRDCARIFFNQSGNSWSEAVALPQFPPVDNVVSVQTVDLLGNGTGCIVWSSPLPNDARRSMRYVALMEEKPHLLIRVTNNLGAETRVHYAPSTKFYLNDKQDGKPWITRLPFPVHVIEKVETYDWISRNRFVTRYAYHHGYFDGEEREFRGFGMVEQFDTEAFAVLNASADFPTGDNIDAASHIAPVHTKTWFHTGVYVGRGHISDFFAGIGKGDGEYYREPALQGDDTHDTAARALLLTDAVLPEGLSVEDEREACRALKGSMLRQEVYALDGTDKAQHPYTVTEQNFTIQHLQPRKGNCHAVFFTHAREAINYHYERKPVDPRVQHALTLDVDKYGNVLKSVAIGYGRRQGQSPLLGEDKNKQEQILITYTENDVTNSINDPMVYPDDYRTPLPCEARTYEVTGLVPAGGAARFSFKEFADNNFQVLLALPEINYEQPADYTRNQKRLIERVRTLYRKDDLSGLLGKCALEPMALPGESYKLAFTLGLLDQIYVRNGQKLPPANPAMVLEGGGGDRGGYVNLDGNGYWWIPTGKIFLSPNSSHTSAQELTYARQHFFLPHCYRDPFHTNVVSTESFVTYDNYDLLILETRDALENKATVGERLANNTIDPAKPGNDYRVLQPWRVMDPNRNRTQVAFDALGMVVATTVMGKPEESKGDNLTAFDADLTQQQIGTFYNAVDPHTVAHASLKNASTCIIYDLHRFYTTQAEPPYAATLARETHVSDLQAGEQTKIQISFSYSDGFGREIQKKIQAEAGPVPRRDAAGKIILDATGQPEMTTNDFSPRWVGSGWTVFNNKGKPIRQYEPFFTDTHRFESDVRIGVSPTMFYDPIERVVATLHPNHTWEKVVFDPWCQETWDVNDTVITDPSTDKDAKGFFLNLDATPRIPSSEYHPTWHELRTDPLYATEFAARYLDTTDRLNETSAAAKAVAHFDTPTIAHFDALGRPFLTIAHNKVKCKDHDLDGREDKFHTRVELDIEGNQREVRDAIEQNGDAKGRIVMRYDYDMLGNRIHQSSMEAGESWTLNDVAGKPLYAWDSRGHQVRTKYDQLRRPIEALLHEGTNAEILIGRTTYGETLLNPEANNLRGKVVQVFDQASAVTSADYDFKGNLRRSQRQLAQEYKTTVDWSGVAQLDTETFTNRTAYDALNRPIQLIAPHSNKPNTKVNIIQPVYNEANLLEQVDAWLDQSNEPAALLNPATANMHAVTDIDYDAKGQRTLIDYGNGVETTYEYDPLTFRLVHSLTQRDSESFPSDCPKPPPNGWPGCQVQNLHYTYDPVGNITHIRDEAQQTIYFRNKRVEPNAEYTYDAIYRLIEARGREHLGQIGGVPIPHSHNDVSRTGILSADGVGNFGPNDGNAMGTYIERYVYDAVGNFQQMQHHGSDPVHPGWTRRYTHNETSLIEDGTGGIPLKTSNRLSSTTVGNYNPPVEQYVYDAHGNMTRMPHLGGAHPAPNMYWDYRNQLHQADLVGGGTAYYVYDAAGQRVRKVWEKSAYLIEERIYLGGFEIFRRRNSTGGLWLERETLHIMDVKQRIALIETRSLDLAGNDPAPQQLIRYQFGNHLGSSSLELDDQAKIISYEEYTPYGSTSYQAVRSLTETPKRCRYTGKERDEESGLNYHTARYYTSWLGRWISADPIFLKGGLNLYTYSDCNPVGNLDLRGTQTGPWGPYVQLQQLEQVAKEIDEATTVEEPGFWEGMIPIWGSGKSAVYHFQQGNPWRGIGYTALAITDVFLVKALVTGVAKGVIKAGAKAGLEATTKQAAELAAKEEAAKLAAELAAKEAAAKQAAELAAKEEAAKLAAELAAKEAAAKQAAELAAKEAAAKQAAELAAKEAAAKTNQLHHIFGQARHNLGNLVKQFGSQEKAFEAIQKATEGAVRSQGIKGVFETIVKVGTETVTVRGNVINNIVKIGTAFKP